MENRKNQDKLWLTLAKNPKIGAVSFAQILSLKLPIQDIWEMPVPELLGQGMEQRLANEIDLARHQYNPEKVLQELERFGIRYLTLNNPNYPVLLKQIYDPPFILYYKGVFEPEALYIWIVGSRKPTDYGKAVTKELAYNLAGQGIWIASGLALGIDTAAHEAALAAKGKTIAVLGHGLDQIYPRTNENLANRICESGAIISEFPVGTQPTKYNFPIRNRIISGLSAGLVVSEAAERSGSLLTARSALEQNREVYAIPGSIYNKNSWGPNNLLKLGAKVVTSTNDILEELGLEKGAPVVNFPQSPAEEAVFQALDSGPLHIDSIIKSAKIGQSEINSVLTLMEISGKIKHLGGMVYRLNK